LAAQAAAVAEAVARAPMAAAPKATISPFAGFDRPRDTFIPRAPLEPRAEARLEPRLEMPLESKAPAAPQAAPAAPAPAKTEASRLGLFGRYRGLAATPQPQAKVERGLSISVGPQDRPVTSHSDDELEIPAFLRRQAN
jgi:cell division protein FtsZ